MNAGPTCSSWLHVLVALAIIGLVLLQHGKGADMGAGFGSGASGSLFGATGSANFLSRTTAVLAAVFFAARASGSRISRRTKPREAGGGVIDARATQQQPKSRAPKPARRRPSKPQRRRAERSRAPGAASQVPQ